MLTDLTLRTNGVPIYVQLREQILGLIGRGALKPGARIPTMRQVAVALKIDRQHRAARLRRTGARRRTDQAARRGHLCHRHRAARREIPAA